MEKMAERSTKTLQVSCVQMHWAKPIEFNLQRTLHFIKESSEYGSRVVLFPEANLTSYYFPYVINLPQKSIDGALDKVCEAAAENDIWAIVGTIQGELNQLLNLSHVINPAGEIVHEYAKINMAGRDEKKYCRGG